MHFPIMSQKWRDLFFLHWEYDCQELQKTLPEGLYIDHFQGKAFLSLVAFSMKGVRPIILPPLPGISSCLELNFRTYVHDQKGNRGIWFYSLDISSWINAKLAKALFHLPYFPSQMSYKKMKNQYIFFSDSSSCNFCELKLSHQEGFVLAEPHSLEHFLIERYRLFTLYENRIFSLRVKHQPYLLTKAFCHDMQFSNAFHFSLSSMPSLLHYSAGGRCIVDTVKNFTNSSESFCVAFSVRTC